MLDAFAPKAVILSGGPASVHEAREPRRAASGSSSSACRCWASATAR